eukprot:gene1865-1895_t
MIESPEHRVTLLADAVKPSQLGERIRMVVGADVQVGVRVFGADLEAGALLAALVAAGRLAGLHGGEQALGEGAFGCKKRVACVGNHSGPCQHVAGHRDVQSADMAGPRHAVRAGVLGDPSGGVDDVELPLRDRRHGAGRLAGAQARHGVDRVERIDERLGGKCGNPALDMDAQRAHGKEPGCDGGTECAGLGVSDKDRIGHFEVLTRRRGKTIPLGHAMFGKNRGDGNDGSIFALPARAADLVVLSAAAMKGAVASMPDGFTAETGDHVRFVFGTAGFIRDKAVGGEAFDVVIVPPAPMADLMSRGLVTEGSMLKLGLVKLGAAVRSGAPHPDISTEASFRAALLAAASIGMADPATGATSGIYLAKLLERLGVLEAVKPKLTFYPEGQVAMEAAARGEIALGLGQVSEILPVTGAAFIGTLPEPLQLQTVYAAGLAQQGRNREAAVRLMKYMSGPQARAAFRSQGFETEFAP